MTARGGSPSTYICRKKHDCIWTKLPWVELSQVTAGGGHLQLIFVETDKIVFGRNCLGSSFLSINNQLLLGEKSP